MHGYLVVPDRPGSGTEPGEATIRARSPKVSGESRNDSPKKQQE